MLIARNSENKIVHYFFLFGWRGGGYSLYMLNLRIFLYYSALWFLKIKLSFCFLFFFEMMMMTIHC